MTKIHMTSELNHSLHMPQVKVKCFFFNYSDFIQLRFTVICKLHIYFNILHKISHILLLCL